ncbi:MAG: polyhydroxyalkanoic acid system family protein [Planctomycetota bacterium]|nr:polyhydroxyalkanoic acid system family protein [Planctomycetota bacterium]
MGLIRKQSMPGFKANVEHRLGKDVALQRLKSFSEEVRAKYGSQISEMQENWDEQGNLKFGFKAMGLTISGELVVDDQEARINGQLPFAAVAFRGTIEQEITAALKNALTD